MNKLIVIGDGEGVVTIPVAGQPAKKVKVTRIMANNKTGHSLWGTDPSKGEPSFFCTNKDIIYQNLIRDIIAFEVPAVILAASIEGKSIEEVEIEE